MRHTNMTDLDDIHYIQLIRSGNSNAFVYIVRRYQKMVFSVVSKIAGNATEAEDITQEVFIKVYQSLDKFREQSGFSTWLYRIAYNTAVSEIRKFKPRAVSFDEYPDVPETDITDSPDGTTTEDRLMCLEMVLKKLKPEDALLVSLFYLNNHSIEEIAEIADMSRSNVKVKLHRIRKYMNFEINKLISG